MLQQMRKFASSWVASIFLGVLALSFGVWGIADIFKGTTDTSVATVGNVKIGQDEFQHEYQNSLRNEGRRLGTDLSSEQAVAMGLPGQVLDRIISRVAVDQEIGRLGLTVSDDAVAGQIRAIPAFAGPSGNFDHNQFLRVVSQSGFTEQSFIAAVRSDAARAQLLDATSNGLELPTGYGRALFDYINEVRAVHYIEVPASAAGTIAKPSDAELVAYVKAHAGQFSTPEYRELTYAAITPADLANEIKVTDKQLKNQYELNQQKYQIPEKRDVEQITFPDQKAAEAASAEIAKGKSFADIATARGLKAKDIQLGEVQEADLGKARGGAAFALAKDGVSKPVKGDFGWVILKVTKIVPGMNKTFAEVKDTLKKQVQQQLAADKISEIVNKFEDSMAGGATLSQAATASGMKAVHLKAIDKDGLMPDGKKADVPANSQFLDQVFKADVGVAGDPFQLPDGSAYALKVDGVTPPALKPLDAVRAKAEAGWMQQKQADALLTKVAALSATADKDKSLDPIAKVLKVKVEDSPALQRGSPAGAIPAGLLGKIFDAKPGAVVFGKADKGDGYIVARITGVTHPPPMTAANAQYAQFLKQIGSQVGNDLPTSLAMAARQNQGVTINQKMVDTVTGSGS